MRVVYIYKQEVRFVYSLNAPFVYSFKALFVYYYNAPFNVDAKKKNILCAERNLNFSKL